MSNNYLKRAYAYSKYVGNTHVPIIIDVLSIDGCMLTWS